MCSRTARVRNQRDFATLEAGGSGDGLAIDAAGRLYVTSQPGVQVFAPDGKYLGLIPTPRNVDQRRVRRAGQADALRRRQRRAGCRRRRSSRRRPGVRNNAKSIYKLPMLAQGFAGRAK